jgi:thiol-disulfide isomerase/thioredoxin
MKTLSLFRAAMTAGLLAAAFPLIGQDSKPELDRETTQILKRMAEFYKDLQTMAVELDIEMKMEMQGMRTEMEFGFEVAAERPNKLAMTSKNGALMAGLTLISDGEKVYTHMQMLNQYMVTEAGEDFEEMFQESEIEILMGDPTGGQMALLDRLLAPDPYAALLLDVQSGSYAGKTKVGEAEAHHLQFRADNLDWEIWVSAGEEPRLLRFAPDMSRVFEEMEQVEGMPDFSQMKMNLMVNYSNWKINPEFSKEQFVFKAPEGAREVENFFAEAVEKQDPQESPEGLVGQAAPDFELELLEGGRMSMEKHRGKEIVILDFWATWCGPCIRAMPILMEVAQDYSDKGVVLYAINLREQPQMVRAFLEKQKWELKAPLDQDGAVAGLFRVRGIPQTVIVDREGIIRGVHVGFSPNLKSQLTSELDALINSGEKPAN